MPDPQTTFRRTLVQLEGRRVIYVLAIVSAIVEAAAMLAFPLVQQSFYDRILIAGQTEVLAPVLLTMLTLIVTMLTMKAFATYLFASVGERVKVEVRSELARHAYDRPLTAGSAGGTGELVSLATNDVNAMGELYRSVLGYGVVYALRLVGTLAVLALIDPRLLLVAVPLLVLYAVLPLGVTPGLRRSGEMVQRRTAHLVTVLQEGFSAIRDIKAFGRVEWGVRRQREHGVALQEAQLHRTRLELASSGSFVVYWVSVVGISWYGAFAVSDGRLTVGGLLALLLYFGQLQQPVSFLVRLNNQLQVGLAAAERIFSHLGPSTPAGASRAGHHGDDPGDDAWPEPRVPGRVSVQGLRVRYPGRGACLEDVTLQVNDGEFVAVVGETGSGKSTLLNAILGFVEPDAGLLLVGGRPLAEGSDEDLRRQISLSSSDAVLFDMTIADNIRFGRLEASDDEIRAAAHTSAAELFIDSLPDGLETTIGQRAERLSTGQRQRVVLARALIRRPSILLLDEATSGLDGPTERLVMDRLLNEPSRPTIIMVTHRLYALERADRIYVLDHGRIVEQGDHPTLLRQGGPYHRLCQKQGLAAKPAPLLARGESV